MRSTIFALLMVISAAAQAETYYRLGTIEEVKSIGDPTMICGYVEQSRPIAGQACSTGGGYFKIVVRVDDTLIETTTAKPHYVGERIKVRVDVNVE